jgi:HSP20 family protein
MAIMRAPKAQEQGLGLAPGREWDPFAMARGLWDWDPWEEMRRMLAPRDGTMFPAFDVKETEEAYILKADLPGVREENLHLSLTGHRLTVSGKREAEQVAEGEHYFAGERRYGSFSRSFTLPEGVDLENVNAQLKDGELSIRIAKRPEVKARQIPIRHQATQAHA